MRKVLIDRYGPPWEVARCAEVEDVGTPGPGEVVFDVLAFPINPADMSFCRGGYRLKPPLPATPGAECVGRVTAVGGEVDHLRPGDLVINLQRENWAQRRRVAAEDAIPLPAGIDLRQAAMVRINPPTALLLLTEIASIAKGDWVIQDVANSAVGRLLIVLARQRGIRTINVVRRAGLADELKALGADAVVIDGPDLAVRAREAANGGAIRLAIDAVGGAATARMAECVSNDGMVVHYGSMSGEDPRMHRAALVYRGVNLTGFMLGRGLAKHSAAEIRTIYATLAAQVMDGTLKAPVDAVYPIEEIKEALAHADKGGRNGKILVAPNGLI